METKPGGGLQEPQKHFILSFKIWSPSLILGTEGELFFLNSPVLPGSGNKVKSRLSTCASGALA